MKRSIPLLAAAAATLAITVYAAGIADAAFVDPRPSEECADAGNLPLRTGPWDAIPGAVLTHLETFRDETGSHACHRLEIDGEFHGWIAWARRVGDELYVGRCFEHFGGGSDGEVAGSLGKRFERVVSGPGGTRFEVAEVPLWDPDVHPAFATAAFCGSLAAYWGREGDRVFGVLYDLERSAVVAKRSAGERSALDLAFAEPGDFPRFHWRDDGASARAGNVVLAPGVD